MCNCIPHRSPFVAKNDAVAKMISFSTLRLPSPSLRPAPLSSSLARPQPNLKSLPLPATQACSASDDKPQPRKLKGSSRLNRWSRARAIHSGRFLDRSGHQTQVAELNPPPQQSRESELKGFSTVTAGNRDDEGVDVTGGKSIYTVSDGTGWTVEHSVGVALGQFEHCLVDRGCSVNTHLFYFAFEYEVEDQQSLRSQLYFDSSSSFKVLFRCCLSVAPMLERYCRPTQSDSYESCLSCLATSFYPTWNVSPTSNTAPTSVTDLSSSTDPTSTSNFVQWSLGLPSSFLFCYPDQQNH